MATGNEEIQRRHAHNISDPSTPQRISKSYSVVSTSQRSLGVTIPERCIDYHDIEKGQKINFTNVPGPVPVLVDEPALIITFSGGNK